MKRFWALICALLLLLPAGCTTQPAARAEDITVTASTYPVYLLACAVTCGAPDIRVERLSTGSVSCLHDYTLSVRDMKKIELSDVLVLNGVELEAFMDDALSVSDAVVIDCSAGVTLLPASGHDDDHEHEHTAHDHGHWDPHIWLDPVNAARMAHNLAEGFAQLDPEHKSLYTTNAQTVSALLLQTGEDLRCAFSRAGTLPGLITFHDGFGYFAHAFDLHLLRSIEEEAGSEASAKEIVDISRLVKEHGIPLIFTEVNGSEATARAIARETGCSIAQLTTLMNGTDVTEQDSISSILARYTDALCANARAILGEVSLP